MSERSIIAHNFKLMWSSKEGGMSFLLTRESMGGNARTEVIDGVMRVCSAANFYFNKDTGEIMDFSNEPMPKGPYAEGIFRACFLPISMAEKLPEEMQYGLIVETIFRTNASREAKKIIKDSVKVYNAMVKGMLAK